MMSNSTTWTLDAHFTTYWTDKSGDVFVLGERGSFIALGVKDVEFMTWSKSRRARLLKKIFGAKSATH